MKTNQLFSTAAVLLSLPLSVLAADKSIEASGGSLESRDLKFVTEASQGGMLEVAVGKLAKEKGSPQTKLIGEMLVKDHSEANGELKKIATEKGVTLPIALNRENSQVVQKLANETEKDFDMAFLKLMEKDHKEDIETFTKASENVKDPELRAFAAKTLPVLQQHEAHIRKDAGKKAE